MNPSYIYDLQGLAKGQRPAAASAGTRYDHVGDHIGLALAERVEALATEMATMNGHLAAIIELFALKMDALTEVTRTRTA